MSNTIRKIGGLGLVGLGAFAIFISAGMATTVATQFMIAPGMSLRARSPRSSAAGGPPLEIADTYRELCERFPAMATPVEPVPADPAFFETVRDPYRALAHPALRDDYRMRAQVTLEELEQLKVVDAPAAGGALMLVGGRSMRHVLPEGSLVWIDPQERAQHGDLVVVRLNDTFLQRVIDDDLLRDDFNGTLPNMCVKLLWHEEGRRLLHSDSMPIDLDRGGHKIVGVIRCAFRPMPDGGWRPRYVPREWADA